MQNNRDNAVIEIAEVLVNQRLMRKGSPPLSNPLDILPDTLRDEVIEDAEAVYDTIFPTTK